MTAPVPPAGNVPRPSVAETKHHLIAWAAAADTSVAALRSRVITGAANLTLLAGITGLAVFAGRRLFPIRVSARKARRGRAPANARDGAPQTASPIARDPSIRSWLGWIIVTRVGRWLLPQLVQPAQRRVTNVPLPGVPHPPSLVHE